MENKELSSEEKEAINSLISRIPPQDLKKAIGGLSESQIKRIITAGILTVSALGVTTIVYNGKKNVNSVNNVNDPLYNWDKYFNSDGSLRKGYILNPEKTMIYRENQVTKHAGLFAGIKNFVTSWKYEVKPGEEGIPTDRLWKAR